MVGAQSVLHAMLGHEEETYGVAQGPVFVEPLLQVSQGCAVQRLAHVDHSNGRVVLEIGDEG